MTDMPEQYDVVAKKLDEHESQAARKILTALTEPGQEYQGASIDMVNFMGAEHGELLVEGRVGGDDFEIALRITSMYLTPSMPDSFDEAEEDR